MPENDKDKHEVEYSVLLAFFKGLIEDIKYDSEHWENLEDLMYQRADIMLRHAFEGFGISYDEAIEIIKNAEDLTEEEKMQRSILLAAFDNLIDFSVAAEYQMFDGMVDIEEYYEELEDPEEDLEDLLIGWFKRYNYRYAWAEAMDTEYAMIVAAALSHIKSDTELMYMTMGDERVRPWHLQYEGYTAPKSQFPGWLIPPIEHGCRCYLVEAGTTPVRSQVYNKSKKAPEMPSWFDKTFKESVALGGKIFSEEHPYFDIKEEHMERLSDISQRIKNQILNGK